MIVLDYRDKRPIYEQISDRMRVLIVNGVLEADEKLPSVRSLAVDLSINPNTIQRAYSELEREGFIYSVKGRGNFVRADENLLARQQEKLLEELGRHVAACRDQQLDLDRVLKLVEEIYQKTPNGSAGGPGVEPSLRSAENPDSPRQYEEKHRSKRTQADPGSGSGKDRRELAE